MGRIHLPLHSGGTSTGAVCCSCWKRPHNNSFDQTRHGATLITCIDCPRLIRASGISHMIYHLRRQLLVGFLFACGALLISWLLGGESSPLHRYFLFHTAIPNLWGTVNMVPVLVSFIIALPFGGVSHGGFSPLGVLIGFIVMFIYWFILGFVLAIPRANVWVIGDAAPTD
jgi:hypothetical protein